MLVKIEKMIRADKSDCVGCYACYNACPVGAITMVADAEGFSYPRVNNLACIKCEKCSKVCPGMTSVELGGAEPETIAAYCTDSAVRDNSSSGGMFHLLAMKTLETGGIVFGAGFNETWEVEHKSAENRTKLLELQTSKYVQSRIGNIYQTVKAELQSGRQVLFAGTPCQCVGLRNYLSKEYENLLLVDFVCHGVPSPLVWEKYLTLRVKNLNEIQSISFRNKNLSWERFLLKFSLKNSNKYLAEDLNTDLYLRGFLRNLYLRPACHSCQFCKANRPVDITLADFWGIQEEAPEMYDGRGTSLCFLHSEKGKRAFYSLDKIKTKKVDFIQGVRHNPSMLKPTEMPANRETFFADLLADDADFGKILKKYTKPKNKEQLIMFIKKMPVIYKLLKTLKSVVLSK